MRLRPTVLLALAVPLLRLPVGAQPAPAGRVLLYAEPNYRGEALVVPAGTALDNLEYVRDGRGRKWNDRIVSVRVEGPVVLVAYEHANFRGAQTTFTRHSADLLTLSLGDRGGADWTRRISSLRAEPAGPDGSVFLVWNRRDAERAVRSAYRDLLGREPDPAGLQAYGTRLRDAGWTEDQLRDQLRRSPEFRARDLGALIRQAYRELLGREPDPAGQAAYTRRLQGGMSEAEFRADLQRSGEYRSRAARDRVTRAYREVLRREPDPAGLAHYTQFILERGWDDNRVRDALRQSDEYRNLPRR